MKSATSTAVSFGLIVLCIISSFQGIPRSNASSPGIDYNPLVDKIYVTVTIKEIRALDRNLRLIDLIDPWTKPNFFVTVSINGNQSKSPVWRQTMYVKDPAWSAACNVPKTIENAR